MNYVDFLDKILMLEENLNFCDKKRIDHFFEIFYRE